MNPRSSSKRAYRLTLSAPLLALACSAVGENPYAGEPGMSSGGTSATGGTSGTEASAGSGIPSGLGGMAIDVDEPLGNGGESACAVGVLGQPGSNPGANFSAWLEARGPVVERFLPGPELEGVTAEALNRFQVLVLDQLPEETAVGVAPPELMAWLEKGGKLVALSGYSDNMTAPAVSNALMERFGLGFSTEQLLWGPVNTFAVHPITEGLVSLSFIGGREVIHREEDAVIMTVGSPPAAVGVAAERGAGKAFVFGDEWITYDSEWSSIPEIEKFWFHVFAWLGGCELTPVVVK